MEIKKINQNELELLCVDVLTRSFADLGQKDNDPSHKVMLAQNLAKDLKSRYSLLPFKAVELAFENGVRETDKFVLCAATWCKWLNVMQKEIWKGWHNYKIGNKHCIQKHISEIMEQQTTTLLEYEKGNKPHQISLSTD